MIRMVRALGVTAAVVASCLGNQAVAQTKQLTLCWAAWDPANALVELSKDFTAKTGIEMKFEFVPWTSYADRFLNELNSQGQALRPDHRRQPVDRRRRPRTATTSSSTISSPRKESRWTTSCRPRSSAIRHGPRARRTTGRCRRWATRSAGPTARTGSRGPKSRPSSRRSTAATSPRRKTWDELKQIAEFFQGREIDGKKVYGASIFTERGSEGITMGVTTALYDWGFQYENPKKPYQMEGFVNSPDAVEGLEFYKSLYKCCTPPGMTNAYMYEGLDAFKSGPGRDADELVRLLPRPLQGSRMSAATRSASSSIRGRRSHFTQLGGQGISVVSYCEKQDDALSVHQMVRPARRAEEVVGARRLFLPQGGARRPGFPKSAPFAADFLKSMDDRQGLLGGAVPMPSCCSTCRSASMTTSWPTRAPPRRRSTCWSRTGPKVFEDEGKIVACSTPQRSSRPLSGRETAFPKPLTRSVNDEVSHEARLPSRAVAAQRPRRFAVRLRRPVRPGHRLAVHHADHRCCCWRSTSSR